MATKNESEPEEKNDDPVSSDAEQEGLSAEQAVDSYSESDAWQKSKNTLLTLLGLIAIGVASYSFLNQSQIEKKSERSYRFLSASIDSEGAEERFLSFANDYDDNLAGVARFRAAVIQYKDKRYEEAAQNFQKAAQEMGKDPLSGRALIGQAVSLLKSESQKGDVGKSILVKLAESSTYLPTDRNEARYLLALQSLAENDMSTVNDHKGKLADDINASYFLTRLEDLIKTEKFLAVAKSLPDINLDKGQAFLKENEKREGVVSLDSGLQYEVLKKGKGGSPNAGDRVEVHYQGTLINGEVFDSSLEREDPASFSVNGVIKGWTEALQLMNVGAKWKLFIPSELAYGENGNNSIGPNETLIFEVELIGITPKEIPESSVDLNVTDADSSSSDITLVIPESDVNASVPVVEENSTAPVDRNVSE